MIVKSPPPHLHLAGIKKTIMRAVKLKEKLKIKAEKIYVNE